MYEPVDALEAPRYSGPRTFARLPALAVTEGVDVAIFGMPWDSGTSFRPGARFGPEGVRSASALLRPYNPAQDVQVFGAVSCVDHGDAPTVPGYIEDTLARIATYVEGDPSRRCDPARDRRRSLGHARRAACRRGRARAARARAPRLAPRRLGLVLRPPAEPRHGLPAGLRGGAARPVPLHPGGDARRALLGGRLRGLDAARDGDRALARAARALGGRVRRAGASAGRGRAGLLHLRRRLRRPGVLPGDGDAGGRGARARRRRSISCGRCAASTSAGTTWSRWRPRMTGPGRSRRSSLRT